MNEPPDDPRARLLAEAFHDDWATGPASTLARRAAASARRRRRLHRTALVGAASVAALACLALAYRSLPVPSATIPVTRVAVAPFAPAFEIITDEQLFAELRDRSVLILPHEKTGPRIVILGP